MQRHARDLSVSDIGRTITVATAGTTVVGILTGIHATTDVVAGGSLVDAEPAYVPGRQRISIIIFPGIDISVGPKTEIDLQTS